MCALALSALGCGKSEPKPASDGEPREADAYDPTPSEMPLAADFTPDAEQRVVAENYRKELDRIERELAALQHAH